MGNFKCLKKYDKERRAKIKNRRRKEGVLKLDVLGHSGGRNGHKGSKRMNIKRRIR